MHPVPGHASQLAFSGVLRAAAGGPACADRPRIEWRTIVASRAHVRTHIAQGSIYTRLLPPARAGPQGTRGACACARRTTRRPRSGLRSRAVVRGQPRPGVTDTSCGMCGGVGRGVRARCITLDLMLKGLRGGLDAAATHHGAGIRRPRVYFLVRGKGGRRGASVYCCVRLVWEAAVVVAAGERFSARGLFLVPSNRQCIGATRAQPSPAPPHPGDAPP